MERIDQVDISVNGSSTRTSPLTAVENRRRPPELTTRQVEQVRLGNFSHIEESSSVEKPLHKAERLQDLFDRYFGHKGAPKRRDK